MLKFTIIKPWAPILAKKEKIRNIRMSQEKISDLKPWIYCTIVLYCTILATE